MAAWRRAMLMGIPASAAAALALAVGCARHTVDVQPIRVEPIHMTVDINIKVDRELDEFFDYEDAEPVAAPPVEPAPKGAATQPAAPSTQPTSPGGLDQ